MDDQSVRRVVGFEHFRSDFGGIGSVVAGMQSDPLSMAPLSPSPKLKGARMKRGRRNCTANYRPGVDRRAVPPAIIRLSVRVWDVKQAFIDRNSQVGVLYGPLSICSSTTVTGATIEC